MEAMAAIVDIVHRNCPDSLDRTLALAMAGLVLGGADGDPTAPSAGAAPHTLIATSGAAARASSRFITSLLDKRYGFKPGTCYTQEVPFSKCS